MVGESQPHVFTLYDRFSRSRHPGAIAFFVPHCLDFSNRHRVGIVHRIMDSLAVCGDQFPIRSGTENGGCRRLGGRTDDRRGHFLIFADGGHCDGRDSIPGGVPGDDCGGHHSRLAIVQGCRVGGSA